VQAQHHLSAGDFAAKWRQATTTEKAGSQEHFIDLCRMLSQPTPHDAGRLETPADPKARSPERFANTLA